MVVGSFLFQTAAPISQTHGLLQAIEERLNDGHPPKAGGLLISELLWVEGAQVDTPTLKLPRPRHPGHALGPQRVHGLGRGPLR